MSDTLHTKYRPDSFDEVIGQESIVRSLKSFEEDGTWPHSFLFSGDSGLGKTTLARIIGHYLGAELVEIDAATHSGADHMRRLIDGTRYKPVGTWKVRMYIIDECQGLSKQAWDSMLKVVEEAPPYTYFVFCTTMAGKVPKTIKTRCHAYDFKPVEPDPIADLLRWVADEEEIDQPDDILWDVAVAAEGSPRQALVYLSQIRDAKPEDVREIISNPGQDREIIDFCRYLVKGQGVNWQGCMKYIKSFERTYPAESVRIMVVNYFAKVAMGSTKIPDSTLAVLDAFSGEWPATDKYAPMMVAIAELLD